MFSTFPVFCVGVLAAVILVRPLWVFPVGLLLIRPRGTTDPDYSWRSTAVVSWAGMRGVVTLAAAFVLPSGVSNVQVLVLGAFVVTAGTLLLQGLSLPWLARRLGLAVLTLWLCSVLVFFATAALGDPIRAILGKDYATSPERVATLTRELKLDQPLLTRYLDWLGGLFTGRLGNSIANGLPVSQLVGDRIVNSAVLVLISAIVMIPVAFGIAMISANYRGKRADGVIQIVMIILAGLPEFVVGILLVALFSTTVLHLLPAVTIAGGGAPPGVHSPA